MEMVVNSNQKEKRRDRPESHGSHNFSFRRPSASMTISRSGFPVARECATQLFNHCIEAADSRKWLTPTRHFDIIRNMEAKTAVSALAALAQDTRLAIFRLLVEAGPAGVPAGGIAARLGIAAATLSFHLKGLAHAGLVEADPQGRFIVYRADFDAMNALVGYLTENCCRAGGACAAECAPATVKGCAPAAQTRRRATASKLAPATSRRRVA
jgi:ArsR family transcriptional regulator, arsenate/arsenite/antimonite-responsive transcriptional repressor